MMAPLELEAMWTPRQV